MRGHYFRFISRSGDSQSEGVAAAPVAVKALRASSASLRPYGLPAQLAAARNKARPERLAANRAMTCDQCGGQATSLPESPIPP